MYFRSLLPVPLRFEQTLFRRTVKDIELQLDVHYSPKVVSCFNGHLACDDTLPPRHPGLRRLAHGDNFTDEELERRSINFVFTERGT